MGSRLDITGERSGKLVAVKFAYISPKNKKSVWECRCDCGNTYFTFASFIKNKKVKSCGCIRKQERCIICGGVIGENKYKYCSTECSAKGDLLRAKKAYNRQMETEREKKARKRAGSPLDKALLELEAYNREHNTCLSYGKFEHMRRMERLKNGKQ